jgi:uncharacterized protein (DUF2164 family)
MHIHLSEERRTALAVALQEFCSGTFDEELSDYRAEGLVDFFVKQLGPTVYNQAIQDARGFLLEKLDDLDVEFYEPDPTD